MKSTRTLSMPEVASSAQYYDTLDEFLTALKPLCPEFTQWRYWLPVGGTLSGFWIDTRNGQCGYTHQPASEWTIPGKVVAAIPNAETERFLSSPCAADSVDWFVDSEREGKLCDSIPEAMRTVLSAVEVAP